MSGEEYMRHSKTGLRQAVCLIIPSKEVCHYHKINKSVWEEINKGEREEEYFIPMDTDVWMVAYKSFTVSDREENRLYTICPGKVRAGNPEGCRILTAFLERGYVAPEEISKHIKKNWFTWKEIEAWANGKTDEFPKK